MVDPLTQIVSFASVTIEQVNSFSQKDSVILFFCPSVTLLEVVPEVEYNKVMRPVEVYYLIIALKAKQLCSAQNICQQSLNTLILFSPFACKVIYSSDKAQKQVW